MNRLVLIGNGFDLAHNLDTRYSDFLKDFWKNQILELNKLEFVEKWENEFISFERPSDKFFPENNLKLQLNEHFDSFSSFVQEISKKTINFKIKNKFLERISSLIDKNWVDIEEEYFKVMKEIFNSNKNNFLVSEEVYSIQKLNKEFDEIKNKLIGYLGNIMDNYNSENKERIRNRIGSHIYHPIRLNDLTPKKRQEIINEEFNSFKLYLKSKNENNKIKIESKLDLESIYYKIKDKNDLFENFNKLLTEEFNHYYIDLIPQKTLLLSFNYTYLEEEYKNPAKFSDPTFKSISSCDVIHIHGNIDKGNDTIIFGYGDEKDSDFLNIENLNDNKYLENLKTYRYKIENNYDRLIEFLEESEFQTFIMGHSCGISDRTLLSLIFEHSNCISIKPYYYVKDDDTDNYLELYQNISRIFSENKGMLKERVINKQYCQTIK